MHPELAPVSQTRRWWIVVLLFVAGFINYLDRAILSVALPVIAVELKLDPAAKGVLLSAFFWSYAFMQLPSGWCSDRYNLRWLYAGAFAIWSIACGLSGFATTMGAMIILRVLLGIGESIYLPGGIKTVSVLFPPEQQGLASGFVNCGTRLGLALGAPLVAWLVVTLSWPQAFIILGFGSLIWLVPWLAVMPASLSHPTTLPKAAGKRPREPLKVDRNLIGLCIAQTGFGYYWYLLVTWLPDYLITGRGIPMANVGIYAVIPYMVFTISEPLGGWVADRLIRHGWTESKARKTLITVAFLSSVSLIPATHVSSDWASVALISGACFAGLATGNTLAIIQRSAGKGQVGVWTGVVNFFGNISGIAAPIITGILIGRNSSYGPAFLVAVCVLLAILPAYWFVIKVKVGYRPAAGNEA